MKRKTLTIVFLLALCVAGTAQSQDPPSAEELKLRVVEKQYDDISDTDRWEIKALYPSIRLTGDFSANDFDAQAKAIVMKVAARFRVDMKGAAAEDERPNDNSKYYLYVGYTTEHFDEEIASFRFEFSEYTGGAHPNSWSQTLNYDLRNKKRIEFADLFKPGSAYLGVISKHSIESILAQLKERSGIETDSDWVKDGAGPLAKNFERWNITNDGLKFTFDPYQVGPYVMGGFETVIPYRRFPADIRGVGFYSAERVSFINGDPVNTCRGGLWTASYEEFKRATVKGKKNTKAYFYGDDGDCPDGKDCKRNAYLVAGDEVIVQREFDGFSCAWFQPSKGAETVGWLKSEEIDVKQDISRPPQNWIGKWSYASNDIEIKETPGGKLHVYGNAFWQGIGDNVHIGEIDFLGIQSNKMMELGDGEDQYDCRVKLRLLGKYLIVSDNLNCGGLNVTFNGVYLKK